MSSLRPSSVLDDPVARAVRVYRWVFLLTTLMILAVFAEPTLDRLAGLPWQRRGFIYAHTVSLDVHAVAGFALLFTVLAQLWAGMRAASGAPGDRFHRSLGRALGFVGVPAFLLVTTAAIVDRALHVPDEKAVLFEPYRGVVVLLLMVLVGMIGGFTRAAWVRVRRGDIAGHLDAVLMMFLVLAGIVLFRLLYTVVDAIWGYAPLTIPGMYVLSVSCILAIAVGAAALAGRLGAMRRDLGWVVGVNVLVLLAVAPTVDFVKSEAEIEKSLRTVQENLAELEAP